MSHIDLQETPSYDGLISYLIHHLMTVGFRSKKIIYVQDDDLMFSSYYFVKGNLVIEEFVDVNVVDQ